MAANACFRPEALADALGDPSRRAILAMLCERPASVTTLASALPVSRPAVSQHLRVLKDVGLVQDRAEGTRRIYTVQPDALAAIRASFDPFGRRSLLAFGPAAAPPPDTTSEEQP